jgi:geranylgeranyl reductase family protein
MQVAVVGGGPAGAWCSTLLARRGHSVTLIDAQAPWEKPCGGGLTTKALSRFGLLESGLPRKDVQGITIYFADRDSVSIKPVAPLAVVSRRDFGQHMLDGAAAAGVKLVYDRVTRIERSAAGFQLVLRSGQIPAEFLIGADGARSLVRKEFGTALPPEDLCITLGYFIPGDTEPQMKIFFVPSLEGYIWSFARPTHLSYGLITRSGPGRTARAKELLTNFIVADLGSEVFEHAEFYSAAVPCLGPKSWKNNVVSGKGWALIGDAAGLVDPITGEGISFALRSAEILAENFDRSERYPDAIWNEIGKELARSARFYKRFYQGRFLGGDFRRRTIQLAKRSRTIRTLLGQLVAGDVSYLHLKKKLLFSVPSVGWDLLSRRN